MTIAQYTRAQAYQLNKGGTPARMAILRRIAADSVHNYNPHTRLKAGDWRGARSCTLASWEASFCAGLDQGFNGSDDNKSPVWYTHQGSQFRDEKFADEYCNRIRHKGWFTDTDRSEKARGIVGRLTHGRFIAGYHWSDNDERVYFPEIFTDESDAALMADEHARVFSELEYENSEQFDAAMRMQSNTEDNLTRLRECIALRHKACMPYIKNEISELIETIRRNRETMHTDYSNYI